MAIDFDTLTVGPVIAIFGNVDVWYRPAGQQPIRITGVFDEGAKDLRFDSTSGEQISDNRPLLGIRVRDLTDRGIDPDQVDKVTLTKADGSSADYQVSNVDTDGQGGAKLTLNRLAVPA